MSYKIALIGMMGSGKTTIAKKIGSYTGVKVFELDEIFEKKFQMKISDFFNKFSEKEFRKEENIILKEVTQNNDNYILSTGGGVILNELNRKILFCSDIKTIYLKASFENIYERIKNDKTRPLLLVDNPKKEIEKLIIQREKYYSKALYTIETNGKQIEEIANEIIGKIWIK